MARQPYERTKVVRYFGALSGLLGNYFYK